MHPDMKRRIRAALEALREGPGQGKPLTRELSGWWSLRVASVRIVYRATRKTVEIGVIGPRVTIYLDAARRLRGRR
jgi:mRNA-degrading endonuclease RelE of RelBE toxin-antitoxin system